MAVRIHSSTEYLEIVDGVATTSLNSSMNWTCGAWVYAPVFMGGGSDPCPIMCTYNAGGGDINVFLGISYNNNGMTPSNRWCAGIYDQGGSDWDIAIDTASHVPGRWQHIVGIHDNAVPELRLYINGRFVSNGASASNGTNPTAPFRIGRRWNESATIGFFDGFIEDAWIYHAALKADEILRIYKGALPLDIRPSSLRGYWPLRGQSGGKTLDLSANQAHMTVVGTPSFEPGPTDVEGRPGHMQSSLIFVGEVSPPGFGDVTTEAATVRITLTPSSAQEFVATDSNEIYINLQASGIDLPIYIDTATVRVRFTIDSHDCLTRWDVSQLFARSFERFEHTSNHRWRNTNMPDRFVVVAGDGLEEC